MAAEQTVVLLATLKAATVLMCEEKQPTVSIIAPLRTKLLAHFECAPDDIPFIKEMKRVMAEDLRERYVDEEPFLLCAAALDPRFKKLPFLSDERRNETFDSIAEEAAQLKERRVCCYSLSTYNTVAFLLLLLFVVVIFLCFYCN